jgi:NAD(P)-dependent dehydrogenase (short-subunit alcohol dehydrogenase family)
MANPDSIPGSVKAQMDMAGRVAVITGGAGYLGSQFAEAVAEMGGIPVLFDMDKDSLECAVDQVNSQFPTCGCEGEMVEIADENDLKNATLRVMERHGHIDVLINGAALTKSGAEGAEMADDFFLPFDESRRDHWDLGLGINLTGTMLTCQIIGKIIVTQGHGSIINIASDISIISPDHRIYEPDDHGYPGTDFNSPVFYSVSKAGVVQLTRYLATLWATKGVRVNAVSPAGVYRNHDPAFIKKFSTTLPMARMAERHEFKGAIVFLASDASSFVTGTNLMVDGGRTCW